MGFLSALAKIAPVAGAVAAPFTGGSSLAIGGALGGIAGKAAGGAATNRTAENANILEQNRLKGVQYGVDQNAATADANIAEDGALARAKLGIEAPTARARQSVLGALMQNVQAAKLTPPKGVNMAQMSGGLTPAIMNAAAREGGAELQKQALLALMNKSDIPAATVANRPTAPVMDKYKEPGKMESILSGIGLVGSGMGALGQLGLGRQGGGVDLGAMQGPADPMSSVPGDMASIAARLRALSEGQE